MNVIRVKSEYMYNDKSLEYPFYIDGIRLDKLLYSISKDKWNLNLLNALTGLYNKAESDFIWNLIDNKIEGNLPILVCPDDVDFSCTIILVSIHYIEDKVVWKKFGRVIHNNSKEERIKCETSGIRDFENWTDRQWERYGEQLNTFDIWDDSWKSWISKNWYLEQSLRLKKYFNHYINQEDNIKWFPEHNEFQFNIDEYKKCIETLRDVRNKFYSTYNRDGINIT